MLSGESREGCAHPRAGQPSKGGAGVSEEGELVPTAPKPALGTLCRTFIYSGGNISV